MYQLVVGSFPRRSVAANVELGELHNQRRVATLRPICKVVQYFVCTVPPEIHVNRACKVCQEKSENFDADPTVLSRIPHLYDSWLLIVLDYYTLQNMRDCGGEISSKEL